MNLAQKIIAGSPERKTRIHSLNGKWGLNTFRDYTDCWASLRTAASRYLFHRYPELPWLTYPAVRALESLLPRNARVFEFGGGMSTVWLSKRFAEVHTVEDDQSWHRKIAPLTPNPARIYYLEGSSFLHKIENFPKGHFDLVVIDGIPDRYECLRIAEPYVRPGGYFVLDDTDRCNDAAPEFRALSLLERHYGPQAITSLTGWIPGSFFVKTTTICRTSNPRDERLAK
jgi:hypothetical protein